MQPLSRARTKPAAPAEANGDSRCAKALLDTLPPVMWFVRRQMRAHRGGLSLPQFRTLVRVNQGGKSEQDPDVSLSAVAEHLGSSLPTASRIVTGLVGRGYLARTGSAEDRRKVSLALTPRGRDVLNAARANTQQTVEKELLGLSDAQRSAIVEAMEILRGIFGSVEAPLFPGTEREPAKKLTKAAARV